MAALIVIGFDNQVNARAAYDETVALQTEFIIDLRGVAIVTVDAEGETHVETPQKMVGRAATSGALWGMLVGLLFFVPFLGAALGGAAGALIGKLAKSGINDTFRNQVQDSAATRQRGRRGDGGRDHGRHIHPAYGAVRRTTTEDIAV